MGKKKFEKNKGVTFKLVFRSEDEQTNPDQTLSERIFSVIEADKKKADKENDKERQKILSQFTKEDLGQAPAKKAKPHHGAIKASGPPTDAVPSHTKGRDDLWITHLMRMKEQAKAQAEAEEAEEEEEEERKQALLKKAKQPVKKAAAKKEEEDEDEEWEDEEGEDEEWEDEEEEDEEEEEYEEIEEEEEEEEVEDVKLFKKKAADEDEEQGNKNVLEKIEEVSTEKTANLAVNDEDFPELGADGPSKPHRFVEEKEKEKTKEQVLEEMAEEEIDLKKVNVKGAVRMKRYDDMGLPMDGYNYYQHVVDPNSGGAPSFSFTTTYDKVQHLPEDIDLKKEKMNAEEKEVYEALEFEGEGAYQELEDDFFTTLTKAEAVVVEEGAQATKTDGKKVTFGDNDIKEILSTKDEKKAPIAPAKDGIYSRKDFQKVLKQQVEVLKEKYKEERQKNRAKYNMPDSDEEEEEEEVEEVDESWDEDDEENRPKGYIERVKWEDDIAAQQCVAKSMSSLDSEEDYEERRTKASKAASTRPQSEYFPQPVIKQTKLNIVKEETNKKAKKGGKDAENKEEKEGKEEKEEKESDSEGEEDEEEEKNKVEEVFKKREKGETKEEKKQRKAAIKQFKQERKEKKKKFKENFESKKKEHITMAHKQSNSLQGLSIYKLTV